MKKVLLILLVLIIVSSMFVNVWAATVIPGISWSHYYGGGMNTINIASSIQQTSDGGYIVAGYSNSNVGDVIGNHGLYDYWIVKLDSSGGISWSKCFGGSGEDIAYSIQQTSDGGYILAGSTNSIDGDVTGAQSGAWIVKLDSSGVVSWDKCLGGEGAYSVQQTSDGGYIVAIGASAVKLDNNGVISWSKDFDGGGANSVQQTSDGGYIVAGGSWVTKLDNIGGIIWSKSLDGTIARNCLQQTSDGGYIAAGTIIVPDWPGSIYSSYDYWVAKLDSSGEISWNKHFGEGNDGGGNASYNQEYAKSIQQTSDGGYIVAGYEYFHFSSISWVAKLSAAGGISWESSWVPTSSVSNTNCVKQTSDGGYIVAGFYNYGISGCDYNIVKLTSVIFVQGVSLDKDAMILFPGETITLTATVSPADATDKTIQWTSDNEATATVDTNGTVEAFEPGVTIITATTVDGNKSDNCTINVVEPPVTTTYAVNGSYISGVNSGTTVDALVGSFRFDDTVDASVKKADGTIISGSAKVGTGTTISFTDGAGTVFLTYTIVIYGDTTGDGSINALDLIAVKRHILGLQTLSGANATAANTDHGVSGSINALDLLKIKRHILGLEVIVQ